MSGFDLSDVDQTFTEGGGDVTVLTSRVDALENVGIDVVADDEYTFVTADRGKIKVLTHASGVAATVPNWATLALGEGGSITVVQGGAGPITFSASGGGSIVAEDGFTLITRAQDTMVTLIAGETSNTYRLVGGLEPE